MKKNLLTFVLLVTTILQGFSQTAKIPATNSKEYEVMKAEGKFSSGLKIENTNNKTFQPSFEELKSLGITHKMASSGCGCYQAPDATYTLAMAPNDDLSTGLLAIPFTFCLYGTNYTTLYINNNGNISFGTSYGTFSSSPFPSPSYIMVAPFWGDVDTRGTGTVKYKITPTAMYINWEAVGYYSTMTDKVNTFQLIITDGSDPVLPPGNNIAFCYGDMQWTTGAASGGVGGFGGVPSTVGVNKGDGVNYIQIGRFDQPGAAYDGGYGANDGVSWLDNQSFYFNGCSGNNIAPIVSITPPLLGGGGSCDTLKLCGTGDTLLVNALFLSPEIGQTTTITVNTYGVSGITLISNTPGNTATANVQIIASPANAGLQLITFTATDDGIPVQTTVVNLNIFIDTTGLAAFNPVITGVLDFCEGTTTLSVTPTTYDSYIWSTGSTTTSAVIDSTGEYWVTSNLNGCYKTNFVQATEHPIPTPVITGNLFSCLGSTTLSVDSLIYANYLWSNSSTNDSTTVGSGTYTVNVTDGFGCSGISPPVTIVASVLPVIAGTTAVCNSDSAALNTVTPYVSYLWSNGSTNDTAFTSAGTYTVSVTDINGCVMTSPPFPVNSFIFTLAGSGVMPYCLGQNIVLTATPSPSAGASLLWSTSATTPSISVSAGGNYTVTVSYSNGCTTDTTLTVAPPNPLPTPAITGNLISCGTTPNSLSVDSASLYTTFLWSTSSTTSTTSVLSGTVTLTVTDFNGCVNSATTTVVNFNPLVSIAGVTPFCPGDNITLTAVPTIPAGANYIWSNLDNTSTTTINSAGSYFVTVTYANGCSTSDSVSVTQFSTPVANYATSPITPSLLGVPVNFFDLSTVVSSTITNWVWYFGDNGSVVGSTSQNPAYTYGQTGIYPVVLAVQSANGCWDTITFNYEVIPQLLFPNIFTPNNDGENDYLKFESLDFYAGSAISIYNRWGNLIYESSDYKNNWNGGDQSDGVYYYVLSGPRLDKPIAGFVQLQR